MLPSNQKTAKRYPRKYSIWHAVIFTY